MIKLFASDMDGTLLNEHHFISKRTAEAIKQLQAAGIEFMIATGRTYLSARPLLQEHQLTAHMITLNGAAIYNREGELVSTIAMEPSTVAKIMSYCATHGLGYTLLTDSKTYVVDVEAFTENMRSFMPKREAKSEVESISQAQFADILDTVHPLEDFDFNDNHTILKMMIFSPEDPDKFIDFRATFESYSDIDITSSAIDNLEITHSHAQKGIAIETFIHEERDFTMDEVATIGDSLNDRSMLQMAGYSYAMDNASDEVKQLAKYIAPANTEDGVAQIIDQITQ